MALATVRSFALSGLNAPEIAVEVHINNGLPSFALVGLPDTEVKEARDRVRAAIINSGYDFPRVRLTVNLAPADLPKESGRFDLPIAIGILAASHQIRPKLLATTAFAGELSLSGELRPIRGALAMLLSFPEPVPESPESCNIPTSFVLPQASAQEAALAGHHCQILGAKSLKDVCAHLQQEIPLEAPKPLALPPIATSHPFPDLCEVKGQHRAKRALEIAASGQHSLLMTGPPGSGKSMLASRLPGILPQLDLAAARRSAAILSLVGRFQPTQFKTRPFRFPHHSASAVALVGGGNPPRPGEISLATEGILFLDELPEFDRKVLESLREPLETGLVHIARAGRHATFPAHFQLVAAMNPCPCGWAGHPGDKCHCSPEQILRYRRRLSGPLLDRIDLQIEVPAVPADALNATDNTSRSETSETVLTRVTQAQTIQLKRQGMLNAHLKSADIVQFCPLQPTASQLLRQIMESLDLSARAYHRLIRIARTIADLAAVQDIEPAHIAEASQLRRALGKSG